MPKITIVGTGLIGTSMALALKKAQIKNLEIVGTDAEHTARAGAQKSGAFNSIENGLTRALRDADIIVLATPIMAMKEIMEIIASDLLEGCIVTDVGSSKQIVLDWADEILPRSVDFVGGHPMAGKETSGPKNADADLFRGKPYCIVPSVHANKQAVSTITSLAEAVGARPYFIGVGEHDSYVAAASHLPFIMSTALIGCTSKSANWEDIAQLASSGYHDVTRLASGDPIMHRDICLSNPEPIVSWIDAFIRELYEIRNMLNGEDGVQDPEVIGAAFESASEARAMWLAGAVSAAARQRAAAPDIPTFSESMGEMMVGRRAMEAQKKFFNRGGDRNRKDS